MSEVRSELKRRAPEQSTASWAIRFAASRKNVAVVLSGMSNMEQVEDNTSYMQNFVPLIEEEEEMLGNAAEIIRSNIAVPCTACRYCVSTCPMDISIPDYFSVYNTYKRFGSKSESDVINYYGYVKAQHGKPEDCVQCGSCEDRCPQHLLIKTGSSKYVSGSESILIDLSSWYKDSLSVKIELIQNVIEERKMLRFHYYAPNGDSVREIEPYFLIFKWSSWYVWGWCRLREDYRMFKLTRMDRIEGMNEYADAREVPMPDLSNESIFPGGIDVKAVFQPEMKWHLIEEFGTDSFKEQPDGTLLFEHEYTDKENLIIWMLTCKDKVTVLEPKEIRDELFYIANNIKKKYEV